MHTLSESYWPADDSTTLLPTTCGSILYEAAEQAPDQIALIDAVGERDARRRWTYSELLNVSERTAHALRTHFQPGDHVAVWAANCPEWVILQFGIALAGMVLVTVNPAYRASELAYVLRQSKARGIFHQKNYRGLDMAAAIDSACKDNDINLNLVRCIDEFDKFLTDGLHNSHSSLPTVRPEQAAMIQYTSGTTGQPKGALLNHYSITNNSRMMALLKGLDKNTINLAVAPLFHTAGCVGGVLGSVQTLGTLVLPDSFDADSMLDLIEQEHVTYTFAVPTMLIALLNTQAQRPRNLSSLSTVFSGGATVPIEVVHQVEKKFNARLIIGYGQTETSPAITHTRLDDEPRDKSETIGLPLPQVEVKIINPSTGATMPIGESGELCTRGFLVMMGYFEMPQATAETIDSDGWLHTGDLCTMDSRGYCRITGRLKDMIIRGGENIYPREIEEILYTHPAIAEVAVIGLPDDYWGEAVGAVITLTQGVAPSSDELKQFVGAQLSKHKIPSSWFKLEEIPTTASGKIRKYKLVEMFNDGKLANAVLA